MCWYQKGLKISRNFWAPHFENAPLSGNQNTRVGDQNELGHNLAILALITANFLKFQTRGFLFVFGVFLRCFRVKLKLPCMYLTISFVFFETEATRTRET